MKNPRLLQTTKTMLATVALTGLMAGSAARLHAAMTGNSDPNTAINKGQMAVDACGNPHSCKGQNSCKGQGGCKTSDQGCIGKNTCKGKGGCKTNGPM
jgi:hypothetical protein